MKQFKLIKEYPGSPELGYVLKPLNNNTNQYYFRSQYIKPEDYPEFWEKVIEKDYEILSFKYGNGAPYYHTLKQNGLYSSSSNKKGIYPLSKQLKDVETFRCEIYSVKRLSDGKIFKVGDDILEQGEHSKIEYFEVRGDDLVLRINHQITKGSSTILISANFKKIIINI